MKKILSINIFKPGSIILFSFFFISVTEAKPKRIQSVLFDKGTPYKIFMHPGLGTVLSFPCFISDSFIGDETQIEVKPNPSTRKNLLLNIKHSASRATNLIVRCEGQRSHFVLDLVPSRSLHQDVLEIRASFGQAELMDQEIKHEAPLIEKEKALKKIVIMAPVLLETSQKEIK